MTSKLRRTIVGVGIALGGAAPACFGRTDVASDFATPGDPDEGNERAPDDGSREPNAADAAPPDRADASDGGASAPDAADAGDGATMDAATDAPIDPFCDVSWPPTKANWFSGPVACVDPLNECKNTPVPYQCFRLIEPHVCDPSETRVGPLYCIGGEWRCPPGAAERSGCLCYGPLPAGKTCTDAGVM
jgi:hypothetical protein